MFGSCIKSFNRFIVTFGRCIREAKKKTKKHFDGLSPNGGGVSGQVHFSLFFNTIYVKNMSNNWKKNDKTMVKKNTLVHIWGVWGGGVSGELNPSKCFFVFLKLPLCFPNNFH